MLLLCWADAGNSDLVVALLYLWKLWVCESIYELGLATARVSHHNNRDLKLFILRHFRIFKDMFTGNFHQSFNDLFFDVTIQFLSPPLLQLSKVSSWSLITTHSLLQVWSSEVWVSGRWDRCQLWSVRSKCRHNHRSQLRPPASDTRVTSGAREKYFRETELSGLNVQTICEVRINSEILTCCHQLVVTVD